MGGAPSNCHRLENFYHNEYADGIQITSFVCTVYFEVCVMFEDLVIHAPHASTHIPDDLWDQFIIGREEMKQEALASADLYTDLLAQEAWPLAGIVCAEISRIVVDIERYSDDAMEEMAKVGRGVIYTHGHSGKQLRRSLTKSERADLLNKYYTPHWHRLKVIAASKILIDLHTYPVEPWLIERNLTTNRPEICIGFSQELTPASWVSKLTHHFRSAGYSVDHNTPYSGVIDAGTQAAVMLEIRRDMVGDPGTSSTWLRLVDVLRSLPMPEGTES
ncbi:N-formylglutamate amidohydrolase [Alphaproteobacteria bacterium]|nr:N-formylglutamate amidohydrolase [Alphaproteobacteria bacterium]